MGRKKRLLKDVAYEKIKEKILKGEDTHTSENTLVEDLGMSRTPIRQALQRLEHEGFVQILSNQGIVIPDLSVKDRTELTEMRVAIETYALKYSINRLNEDDYKKLEEIIETQKVANENNKLFDFLKADAEFHQYFLEILGNSILISMYKNARERLFTVRDSRHMINRSDILQNLIHEHQEIIQLLKHKEHHQAMNTLEKHITSGLDHH